MFGRKEVTLLFGKKNIAESYSFLALMAIVFRRTKLRFELSRCKWNVSIGEEGGGVYNLTKLLHTHGEVGVVVFELFEVSKNTTVLCTSNEPVPVT